MIVTTVLINVKQDNIEDFIAATVRNHKASVQEPGNISFDVLQHKDEPSRFLLYEAYRSWDDSAAHKKTEHYLEWKAAVADWMAQPREGIPYNAVCPSGSRSLRDRGTEGK
jgi:autoinducer 2-degrading protein